LMEEESGLGDLHNHLIPAVDDGARTLDDTLDAVERLWAAGVRMAITTPHVDASVAYDRKLLERRLNPVDEAWGMAEEVVRERFPDFTFRRGHEVMIDVPDPDFRDPRLRLAGTSFVLIEWPRLMLPPRTDAVITRICEAGYRPIVAHPERYHGMSNELALAAEWRRLGAFLQVNHGSLDGRYGKEPQAMAFELLRRGHVSYLSSDFHARCHLKIHIEDSREWLRERGGGEQFELLTAANPWRVLNDEEPLPVPAIRGESGVWKRMRRWLAE
jgi:protein-tyrosine phosphatase